MIGVEVTVMKSGGFQMSGFFLAVELVLGGSVTNGATPSCLFLYLAVEDCIRVDYLHMSEHFLARGETLTTDCTSPASSPRVPLHPGLEVLQLLLQQHLHPLLQPGFHECSKC